jgi:hypothetical protein
MFSIVLMLEARGMKLLISHNKTPTMTSAMTIFTKGMFACSSEIPRAIRGLGDHLKTGHMRSLQNRPTEQTQNKSIYTVRASVSANYFSGSG